MSLGIFLVILVLSFGATPQVQAGAARRPALASSPVELVNAVNALRASHGLPPYMINPILMATAQAQADFLALTGTMTHAGPGGIGLTDRLLAAGYPLAGDLSLGGFRSENITGGPESMPAEAAVQRWTGDALHLTTMVSPDLTEIGAGVAVHNARVYYVIDCALPTTDRLPLPPASPVGIIFPVSTSTPDAEGNVIHEVKPGQSLWQIAITYETKIDEIKRLNHLPDTNIYPGARLLIRSGVAVTATLATLAAPPTAPPTLIMGTPTMMATSTAIAGSPMARVQDRTVMRVMIGIVVLAILGGGIFTWLGSSRKR
ncbi:MAG TPA: CAP domain-containing protein [Anaerolineales bacterium]|nr:CAP domain-containing protein [Anaerolineales bacterium]